ncbi:hypothetical protein Mapa_012234 [Marchantia paleacea]|nr:hypothetical protein Mapa_012234 [Marchantia paleacea]
MLPHPNKALRSAHGPSAERIRALVDSAVQRLKRAENEREQQERRTPTLPAPCCKAIRVSKSLTLSESNLCSIDSTVWLGVTFSALPCVFLHKSPIIDANSHFDDQFKRKNASTQSGARHSFCPLAFHSAGTVESSQSDRWVRVRVRAHRVSRTVLPSNQPVALVMRSVSQLSSLDNFRVQLARQNSSPDRRNP